MRKKFIDIPVSEAEKRDPALHMEMETLRQGREEQLSAEEKQSARDQQMAEAHQLIGRIQAFQFNQKAQTVYEWVQVDQIHKSKTYKDLPGIGTWEDFCKSIGYSRQHVDEQLKNLAAFGEKFTQTVCAFGVSCRDLKKLRQLTHEGAFTIEGDVFNIAGTIIPVDADHVDDIQQGIDWLLDEKNAITARVEKLEKTFDAAVKEEVKGLQQEKKALLAENKRLSAFDPQDKDRDWSVKQMAEIETATGEFVVLVQKFIIDPRLKDDRHLQARASGHLQEAETALYDLRKRLDEVIDMFND